MRKPKRISIRNVAARAGVSPATVSNVLNGRQGAATPEVAERVQAIARELGYEVDRVASQLRTGKARVVTVLVPSLDNPYFSAVIASLERCVQDEGYDIIVASSNENEEVERSRLSALLSWRPSGVVIIPNDDRFATRTLLDDVGVPYVVVDRITEGFEGDTIGSDNFSAGRRAAEHLLEYGHSNALVVATTTRIANIRERCAGIVQVFEEAGLPAPPIVEVGQTFETVAEGLQRWFAAHERPTAVIALTNFGTLGVLADMAQRNIRIPEDISLVGFDDYAWMRATAPPITAMRQDVERIAAEAWATIRARMDNPAAIARHVRLPCELILRNSTKRIGLPIRRIATGEESPKARPRRKSSARQPKA